MNGTWVWKSLMGVLLLAMATTSCVREIIRGSEESNRVLRVADTVFAAAEAQFALENYPEAQARYQKAGELYALAGYKALTPQVARTYLRMAQVAARMENYTEALLRYQMVTKIYPTVEHLVGTSHVDAPGILGEAEVYYSLTMTKEAMAGFQKAKALYVQYGDKQGEANAILDEAKVEG